MKPEEYKTIKYEPGPITRITHIEGDQRNPLTGEFILEFKDAINRLQRNRESSVAVLMSEGPVFCSGHNLNFVSKMQDWKPRQKTEATEEDWRDQMEFMRQNLYFPVWDCTKPLIAAVRGSTFTGGVELVALCDIAVAAENAIFDYGTFHVTGVGSANLLGYFIGFKRAAEIYMTGWNFSAHDAERWGLINKVVPEDQVEAEAMRYAKVISLMPRESIRLIKHSMRFALNRMGARENIWYGCETNIMGHLTPTEREKEFYAIAKTKGLREALIFRDKPFEEFGYSRYGSKGKK